MVTPYRPDIVIHNTATSSLMLFELTCPLDSTNHLEQARTQKQNKIEFHQILSELDILNYYETLEISCATGADPGVGKGRGTNKLCLARWLGK